MNEKQFPKGTPLKDLRGKYLPTHTIKTMTTDEYEKHLIGEILFILNKLQKDESFLEVARLTRHLRKDNKKEIEELR
tara:strand:+ start:234 stop:464 length:231 start_codon:yes stop_codon:yes gene_type:complete